MTEQQRDGGSILDNAIARVGDAALQATLRREVDRLRDARRFGLVFDRHLPESVRLPRHPVRRGVLVGPRDESTTELWRVAGFADASRSVAVLSDGSERPTSELVVVREFGEPVHPGLRSVERIARGGAPWHTVVNGENFHVLQALRATHRSSVDLIYIDPPYNTGNDSWIYNDRYVDDHHRDKSSKWLSFMERRLVIARELLKPTGVIICAIGDDEHHRLRMLMDQVFGVGNFISNVVWQGGGSSLARFHAGGIDYMLIYARDMAALTRDDVRWKTEKEGLQDVLDAADDAWQRSGHDAVSASRLLSAWWNRNKSKYDPGLGDNVKVDANGTAVKVGDLGNSLYRPNLKYPITDPATGTVYPPPTNGWRFRHKVMDELIQNGSVLFGARPRLKTPLKDMSMRSVVPSFYKDRRASSLHLAKVLGDKRFPFPKDHEVLMKWFRIAAPEDAVVLDFFGGSGTTTEAVLRLNAEDGGTRQSILVTNNELAAKDAKALRLQGHHPGDPEWEAKGVFEHVTRPRIATVVTGTRPDGSTYSEGLAANVEFLELDYLDPGRVRRGAEFAGIAPLLWLEAGATGDRIDAVPDAGWVLTDHYGVLFDVDGLAPFADAVTAAARSERPPRVVFVVTDSPTEFAHAVERLPVGVRVVRLYADHLANYTINTDAVTTRESR